ncbi:hypothetical protein T05_6908 [Trichinella murrelli]|uniref:Uncharacterized protein n=1 Tax=Trichinella murrelli TaxID=144512 RepID=A0A0V0T7T2_9BILA|nr:hypothetical protein T05_6908 [Trichinella murrelli]
MNNFPISVKLMASERHKLVVLKLFWAVTHIQKRLFLNCLPFISENRISHKLKVWICQYGQHLRAVRSPTEIVILRLSVTESQLVHPTIFNE